MGIIIINTRITIIVQDLRDIIDPMGILKRKPQIVLKYEIYQGSEIIEELKDVPPSQPTGIVIYNVPYDFSEEEMAEFTKDFNVTRVKELKQGMFKLEFSKSENALAFIKAELNVIKGRDLIFRVNRKKLFYQFR